MSVITEKRRLMARLEDLESRLFAEKQRLLAELNELETPFSRAGSGFDSEARRGVAARIGAFPWFPALAAAAVVAGVALAGHAILRAGSSSPADVAARDALKIPGKGAAAETQNIAGEPSNPSRQPARVKIAASAAQATPAEPQPLSRPATVIAPASQSAMEPSLSARAADGGGDPGQISAGRALSQTKQLSFDAAPPVDLSSEAESAKPAAAAREPNAVGRKSAANCFVKVSGRVLFERKCEVLRTEETKVAFDLESPVSLTLDHGKIWTATLGGRALGKVLQRGQCWGAKQIYLCAFGVPVRN